MKYKTFTLDKFQEDSINAIENNYSVVVSAPTGSGKTLIAEYIIDKHKDDDKRIIYTAPIKALSNQKYRDFSKEYGEQKVGLMTGDIVINPHAKILIMTTEVYRNMAVSQDGELANVAYVIFDEIHYINDPERGYVWEESIIYSLETVRFLCLSATIPNAVEFSNWIQAIKKHEVKTVKATKRNVPLEKSFYDYELGITTLEKIRQAKQIPNVQKSHGKKKWRRKREPTPSHVELIRELGKDKTPCLFFHFSRRLCQENALELSRKNLFQKNPEIMSFVNEKLRTAPFEINKLKSTQTLKETLQQGIGFHHAGLLPILKEIVEELFTAGKINVLYVTETFAVGINMPAKTVCFYSLRKYDGRSFRNLNTKEYFQIAGRAGRRGIDKIGYVVTMISRNGFNYNEIRSVTDKDMAPIQSQFKLSINSVLNLIERHTPVEIEKILRLSFFSYQKFGRKYADIPAKVLMARYNSVVRKLNKYKYIVDGKLTGKGYFSSKIYADEIAMGEIFATDFVKNIDEYQILLLLAALVYEHRETTEFKREFKSEKQKELWKLLINNEFLKREKKFDNLNKVGVFIHPVYNGKTFFEVINLTNLQEGDIIRIYAQILDRIGQIKKAATDSEVITKMENCQGIIQKVLEGIWLV
ncbi:DEAD/DEAH box helicase [Candidatus Woesearchaeota archaeon]|mgnify:CR=1 FL=1|jgi:superfamily II RNA helicase|nr:DEAD/DEAH box helicase [Candidatus Woesearchaeota archaeon]MBT4111241.1 DEAD/DEAH box helicase [Candidatus Woesearchaeota archaeon]MBT4336821.1 DEAD/DEAH box helicase [Candidatus Woesearchaeota archaeon]MBT4469489.1 DEAD/DEAH box helicase [Candidatus Woesearchaeota archaeon]MBT6744116.1 DEAD/DEAH box helicase [Candidatus Woesearchaeota archaeon]